MTVLTTALNDLLLQSEIVEAYTFEKTGRKTVKDTSTISINGFKELNKIPQLPPAQVNTLRGILATDATYEKGAEIAKCGWHPDLAFKFKKADQTLTIMLSSMNGCNVIKMYKGPEKVLVKMCRPGRTAFVNLAKEIFPTEYAAIPAVLETATPEPTDSSTTTPPATNDVPDSTHQNNPENNNENNQ